MTSTVQIDPQTYRFKLNPSVLEALTVFAIANKDIHRRTFQSNWADWLISNKEAVDRERTRLLKAGYRGDPVDKMYKSARYYFGKKDQTPREKSADNSKRSRSYLTMSKQLLACMDAHLIEAMKDEYFTPASAYVEFCQTNQIALKVEIERLIRNPSVTCADLVLKVKKTYKNRYFVLSRGKKTA